MAQTFTVNITGVDEAVAKMRSYQFAKLEAVKTVVNETAIKVQRGAKQRCPVDTGRLRASIAMEPFKGGLTIDVGTKVKYAPYVEFGTGSKVRVPSGAESTAAQFKGKNPANPGQKAQPFLYPAWEAERAAYIEKLKAVMRS